MWLTTGNLCQFFQFSSPFSNLSGYKRLNIFFCAHWDTKVGSAFRSDLYVSISKHSFSSWKGILFSDKPCFGSIWKVAKPWTENIDLVPPNSETIYFSNPQHTMCMIWVPYIFRGEANGCGQHCVNGWRECTLVSVMSVALFQWLGSSYDGRSPCRLLLIPVHVCWLEYGHRHW